MEKTLIFLLISIFVKDAASQKLQKYNVDPDSMTVSGFSSGAVMATQFHFAYSSKISGVGIFAGVPNYCGMGGKAAVPVCMSNPPAVNVSHLIEAVNDLATRNLIDPVGSVQGDKVFIFHGTQDHIVLPALGPKVKTMNTHYGADIQTEFSIPLGHAFPTTENIGYSGAFNMLSHLYGKLTSPAVDDGNSENLLTFDQSEFFTEKPIYSSMSTSGFIYVPTACRHGERCRLHITFHGCSGSSGEIGNTYASRIDIIGVAEVNNIIVLLPQIAAYPGVNPYSCWDWFGYVNKMFPTIQGKQVYPVGRMVNRIVAG